jgi:uncharacterized damage-inducible protein DinB
METIADLLAELEQEAQATRRVLERVPNEHLNWRPHKRSRSLGQLALHVATVPGGVAEFTTLPSPAEAPQFKDEPSPTKASDLVPVLDESLAKAKRVLTGMSEAMFRETWRVTRDGREILALPRAAFLRSIMLNHWYHHRGQLTVYLRQLDVPLPTVYGPTADENPFG